MQRAVFLVVLPSAKVKQVTKKYSHRVLLTVLFVHCSHQIITVKYSCKSRFYLLMALTNLMHWQDLLLLPQWLAQQFHSNIQFQNVVLLALTVSML